MRYKVNGENIAVQAAKPAIGQPHNARQPLYNYSTGIEAQLLSASAKLITHSTDSLLPDELLPLSTRKLTSLAGSPALSRTFSVVWESQGQDSDTFIS